ncbi:MAG: TonB-dependent receptor [Bacteroidota bacterium]
MKDFFAKYSFLLLFLGLFTLSFPLLGQKYTVSGYLSDDTNGEKILNATVFDSRTRKGALTNTYGFYSLTLPKDTVRLVFTQVGFATKVYTFELNRDTTININLDQLAIEEVEIIAEDVKRVVDQTQMSVIEIPVDQIKRLPALMGEVDVIKALQLMPGVQSGNEGSSGLYVRGGSPDQNLILLDGVPLYYVSHLGGFFSVFNADALSSVQLYKGGFPARFGERLSSVLDIRMKEGNMKKFEGEGSVSLISAKASFQGPIQKDKTAFIISARRTYIDLLSRPLSKAASNGEASVGYFFYDLNGKINHIISDKDRLYLSFYLGDDRFSGTNKYSDTEGNETYEEKFKIGLNWGNRLAAFRWNHLWSDRLFSNLTATYTRYQLKTFADGSVNITENGTTQNETFGLDYRSQIRDLGIKLDFDFYPSPSHEIKFGLFSTNHRFEPSTFGSKVKTADTQIDTSIVSAIDYTWESGIYFEDNFKIGRNFSMNLGARATHYNVDDMNNVYLQARAAARLKLTDDISLKGSYSQMTQFVHLLANSGVGLPIDLWVPATGRVPAQDSWQAAGGISVSLWKDQFELSLEGYYKEMNGLITFKEGQNLLISGEPTDSWENQVEIGGKGEAYGMEFLLQKKRGKTTSWLGYTLSWNWRQFDNVNNGLRYPFKYDRRHDISLVVTHKVNDRISLAGSWVFGTGNAITIPTGGFANINSGLTAMREGYGTFYFTDRSYADQLLTGLGYYEGGTELFEDGRNGFRMQSYHRLDLSIEFTKEKKWGQRTWSFGVYNAYSRLNPFAYYFSNQVTYNEATQQFETTRKLKKITLFPIIPSVAYKFKF